MFEQEIELEKRQSGFFPMLMIIGLVAVIVGGVVFFVVQARTQLSTAEAATVLSGWLAAQPEPTLHFHAGTVVASVDEKPGDPHYRLLAKAGLVLLSTGKNNASNVSVTTRGNEVLKAIPTVKVSVNQDGTRAYEVPLASRQLLAISRVTMDSATVARVTFSWDWNPNPVGDIFDASGSAFKTFNTWDRALLIDKYGVNFYHGQPSEQTLRIVRVNKEWKVSTE